jgi:hypothetical protein
MGLPSTPNSTMTVKTDDPTKYGITKAPGAPPDITDDAIRKARANELLRLMATRGRKSTFAAGGGGDVGAAKQMAFGSFSATNAGKVGGY